MATTPLGAALITGQGSNAIMDPTMLQFQPDLQIAQGLMHQGLDTSPAYPAQALARLFQAGAGGFIQHETLSDLAKVLAQSDQALAQQFDPETPMGKMARSPDPLVRMMVRQNAGKAALMAQEPFTLKPEERRFVGPNPTAGLTPNQAVGYEGAKAAAQGAGKAPFESGGEGTINTPTGPQVVPITAAERAAAAAARNGAPMPAMPLQMPRLGQGTGSGPAPGGPSPLSPSTGGLADTHANLPGMLPTLQPPTPTAGARPGSVGALPPAAQPGQPGPALPQGAGQPAGGIGGKPLGNPALEPSVTADAKEVALDRENAIKSQQTLGTSRLVLDLLPKVQTGWSADTKLEAARILKGLGVSDDKVQSITQMNVASGQALTKKFLDLSMAAMRTNFGGSREAFGAMQMFRNAYPNIGTDPEAVKLMTNVLTMDGLRGSHLADEKTQYLNDSINDVQGTGKYRGLTGFNEQFNKAHAPDNYVHAAEAMTATVDKPQFSPWGKLINNPGNPTAAEHTKINAIINHIPSGSTFLAPDGTMRVKP